MSSTAQNRDAPSIGWLLLMSTWMLSTVIPGAMFAWLGFLIVGIVSRLTRWIVVGVVLGVAALLVALPIWGQWQGVASAIVYLGGMLLALAANPSWLRTMWARSHGSAAAETPVMASGQFTQQMSRAERRRAARERAQQSRERAQREARERAQAQQAHQWAQQQAQQPQQAQQRASAPKQDDEARKLAERAGASTAAYFATPAAPAEPIDVNEADAGALAGLPGISRGEARKLITQRDKQGGFASLDAFATAANLQPHELVQLRRVAVCSPPARGPRQFGRRVDY